MKLKNCRNCSSKKIDKIFSLGNLYFTGKFLKKNLSPKKGPINLVMCKECKLLQLGDNFNMKYLYGPDYGYQTGINATMTEHVKEIVKKLSMLVKIKKNDLALDIASNDGTLLNFYNKEIITCGIDPLIKKFKPNYKKINYHISDFFSATKIKKKYLIKNLKLLQLFQFFTIYINLINFYQTSKLF